LEVSVLALGCSHRRLHECSGEVDVASTLLLPHAFTRTLVVARTNASPGGGMCGRRKDIHIDPKFGDNGHGHDSINTRNRHQALHDRTMRRYGLVNLAVDDSNVCFNIFNTAELHLEHEPMVTFNLSTQSYDKLVKLLAMSSSCK